MANLWSTGNVTVPDENGVLWAVDPQDIEGWVGNKEYALIKPGAKKVKVFDPNFVHETRDFEGENPHDETVWERKLVRDEDGEHEELVMAVNPLWEEWESSKAATERLNPFLAAIGLLVLFLVVVLVIGALV